MIKLAAAPLETLFLITIRLGMVLLFSPIDAIRLLPIHARLFLVFTLSALILSNIPTPEHTLTTTTLVVGGIAECANGLVLSLSLYAAFAVFQIAGLWIDTQIGLNTAAIFNPASREHEPLSGRLLVMLAVLYFFSLNGAHHLLMGLVLSFKLIAPGELNLFSGFKPITQHFAMAFSLSLMIASPIIVSLMIIDLASAVLTRNMPQISTYFLTLPIKILMGLLLLSLLLSVIRPLMDTVFQVCFQSFRAVLS